MHLVCQFLATTWCAHCNVNKTIHGKACQPPLAQPRPDVRYAGCFLRLCTDTVTSVPGAVHAGKAPLD